MGATLPANVAGDGGLYSTAGDYAQFVRMLLNDGRAGSTRLLGERTVKLDVPEPHRQGRGPAAALDQPVIVEGLPVRRRRGQLGARLRAGAAEDEARPNTRASGSGTWAGIFNTHFWIDPKNEVGVIVMMQTLPFYDDAAMQVLGGVEEIVYRNLK